MKIILIAILILLLISSIKNIPQNLSKKFYEKRVTDLINSMKPEDENDKKLRIGVCTFMYTVISIILIIINVRIGTMFSSNMYVLFLAILEVLIALISFLHMSDQINKIFAGEIPERRAFINFIRNIISIVYYPVVIYLLIQSF